MKHYIKYIGLLFIGLLLGWLFFGDSVSQDEAHSHSSQEANQMWTCSMHPQIMQPEPGSCPICGMDLIPAQNDSATLKPNQIKLSQNAMALANIQTTKVGQEGVVGNSLILSGKIAENEEANTVLVSHFAGRIEHLYVATTGVQVKSGQLLATIYSPELFAAQQELITASSLKETQPDLYQAVRNKLKIKKLSDEQINAIEQTGEPIENFPIYAVHSGTVLEKMVEQGDHVTLGQPLYKLANLNSVWALFDVYENQIKQFKVGQIVDISTAAYADQKFEAKVSFIDPVLNTKTRTVRMRAVLPNTNQEFKPGMFVEGNVKIKNSKESNALWVPSSAVLWTGKRSVVYVQADEEQPNFEMRQVNIGSRNNNSIEILSGLSPDEFIVTQGAFTIDAAAQLQGKKSMMNADGGKVQSGHHHMNNEENHKMKSSKHKQLNAEKDKEQSHGVFQCPMKCEGDKTYTEAGSCPVCKMDLKEQKVDDNMHDSSGSHHNH